MWKFEGMYVYHLKDGTSELVMKAFNEWAHQPSQPELIIALILCL